jgi:DNA-binding transcriptional LysR family regulator
MARSLPPLNALRAFESAARHLSFTLAAAELHVTQAAVSHQVKALEARLGVKLFRRLPRGLLLTDDGQGLLPGLRDGFDRLAQAVDRVGAGAAQNMITISALTTITMTWLVPRLPRFQAAHPSLEIRLTATPRLIDFAREDVDLAIRYGKGHWPPLRADKLFDDQLTPLCGRGLLPRLRHPGDLRHVPILTDVDDPDDWPIWLKAAGVAGLDAPRGGKFDSTRIAVDAAIGGMGVAIGSPLMFADLLGSGRLCQPFDIVVPNGRAYWLVCPQETCDRPKIRAFRDWILAEATAMAAVSPPAAPRARNRSGRAAAAPRRSATTARVPALGDGSGD